MPRYILTDQAVLQCTHAGIANPRSFKDMNIDQGKVVTEDPTPQAGLPFAGCTNPTPCAGITWSGLAISELLSLDGYRLIVSETLGIVGTSTNIGVNLTVTSNPNQLAGE